MSRAAFLREINDAAETFFTGLKKAGGGYLEDKVGAANFEADRTGEEKAAGVVRVDAALVAMQLATAEVVIRDIPKAYIGIGKSLLANALTQLSAHAARALAKKSFPAFDYIVTVLGAIAGDAARTAFERDMETAIRARFKGARDALIEQRLASKKPRPRVTRDVRSRHVTPQKRRHRKWVSR